MIPIEEAFDIQVDKEKMKATLIQKMYLDEETIYSVEEIKALLKEYGILFGIKEELIEKLVTEKIALPLVIAEGVSPIHGKDAILKPLFPNIDEVSHKDDLRKVDLKQVVNIPSVTHGQLIGEKIPATNGISGKNVLGEELFSKPGKDFILRPGKNTRLDEKGLKLFATIDGQMSVEPRTIHVYPIYEVNGDLDLKIGNITFIGSVNIRGNVPAGFEIHAQGDIKIHGTVESAVLISGGSIFVSAGIVGQGKGLIKAQGDLHTSFINQGIVEVEGDVNVTQSILHSQVQAGGNVYCHKGKGNIVGGDISAGKSLIVKDLGNSHNTKTSLYLGVHNDLLQKEKMYQEKFVKAEDDLNKLTLLLNKLDEKEKMSSLTASEKIMKLRIRNSLNVTTEMMLFAKEKLEDFKEIFSQYQNSAVIIEKQIFPNVDVHFGKYRRKIITPHQFVKIYLENGEIIIASL